MNEEQKKNAIGKVQEGVKALKNLKDAEDVFLDSQNWPFLLEAFQVIVSSLLSLFGIGKGSDITLRLDQISSSIQKILEEIEQNTLKEEQLREMLTNVVDEITVNLAGQFEGYEVVPTGKFQFRKKTE